MESEYKGYWWLPDKPDARVHGTLHVSRSDRTILELDGTLVNVQPFTHVDFNPDIILGQVMGGTRLTLYKCFQINVIEELLTGLTTSKLL